MPSGSESNRGLLDRVLTMRPSPRVERLRQRYLSSEHTLSTARERVVVRVMRKTEGEAMVTRRAKAFAAVVREMPVSIFPDELFVGWIGSSPYAEDRVSEGTCAMVEGTSTRLDGRSAKLEEILDTLGKSEATRFSVSDEDRRAIREEIIPYWRGTGNWERTRFARNSQLIPPEVTEVLQANTGSAMGRIGEPGGSLTYTHVGHTSANFEKVLKKGYLGIVQDAEDRLNRIDFTDSNELRKISFLKGVILAMEAAAGIGKRFADKARGMAENEGDAVRKAELLKMAGVCDQVPANPARTFYEALQSVWFTFFLHNWECSGSTAPGRVDQYLYPFYESDLREGRITKEEAQELIDCFLMRFAQGMAPNAPLTGASHHIDVGGYRADGSDATNELSYMFIEGMMHTRMVEPNFGVLVHSKTPDDLLIKACRLCSLGTGNPMFLNHDEIVENFLARGTLGGPPVTLEVARKSGVIGCNEPVVHHMEGGFVIGGVLSMPTPLELVLNNGWSRAHKKRLGLETGDPRVFKSFAELQEAFRKQLVWLLRHFNVAANIAEMTIAEMYPTLFQSALLEDCIEKGICREEGGARYNFGCGVGTIGASDVGDSLAAIKRVVFEEKKITMGQLCDALERNFEGCEELHRMLLKVPKFGNDDDDADEQTAWIMHIYCQEIKRFKNTRGGYMLPVQIPLAGYVAVGAATGALPSGRRAGEPLSDGISPTRGSDVEGPTAVLKSVGKVNNAEVSLGQTLNMRIDPAVFKDGDGFKRFADLIRTLVDQKIHHVQFNIVSSETLRAAQREPEKYQDLLVRVAGYCAYFVRLTKALQDGIIARTQHGL